MLFIIRFLFVPTLSRTRRAFYTRAHALARASTWVYGGKSKVKVTEGERMAELSRLTGGSELSVFALRGASLLSATRGPSGASIGALFVNLPHRRTNYSLSALFGRSPPLSNRNTDESYTKTHNRIKAKYGQIGCLRRRAITSPFMVLGTLNTPPDAALTI